MTTFIYALLDPNDGSVRYVGKTQDVSRRLRRHRTEKGNTLRHEWLTGIEARCQRPWLAILDECEDDAWDVCERYWIAHLRDIGAPLVNKTTGGNGAPGISPSPETRAKIAASVKAGWAAHPREMTPEHRAALIAGRVGMKDTPEVCAKRIASWKRTAETVGIRRTKSMRPRKKHGPLSTVTKAKISARVRGEGNGHAKLTWERVRALRVRYVQEQLTVTRLANENGIDISGLAKILRGESWKED